MTYIKSIYPMSTCDELVDYVDRATIIYNGNNNTQLYAINSDCYQCIKSLVSDIGQCSSLWTPKSWTLYVVDTQSNIEIASIDYMFGEQGVYSIRQGSIDSLVIDTITEPIDSLLPFIVTLILLFLVVVMSFALPKLYIILFPPNAATSNYSCESDIQQPLILKTGTSSSNGSGNNLNKNGDIVSSSITNDNTKVGVSISQRLHFLDTFRGFALTMMIFVNYGGGSYWFMDHSSWNGLTFADLLFPWFVFIMGVSMSISFNSLHKADINNNKQWYCRIIKRGVILFALGLFLANGNNIEGWRIPGVLQYFAWTYIVTGLTIVVNASSVKSAIGKYCEVHKSAIATDTYWSLLLSCKIFLCYYKEWLIQIPLLVIYICICILAKVPHCLRGYNGPGGLSAPNSEQFDCTGGIHRYIDCKVLGYSLLFHSPTCRSMYDCVAYDPEGILGSFSACTLAYLGLMVGRIFIHYRNKPREIVLVMLAASGVLLLLAGLLCGFRQNGGWIPVNKNVWSTSFILFNAGSGCIMTAICYLVVDVYKSWSGAPFIYLGMNSIVMYCGHELLGTYFPFSTRIYVHPPTHTMSLISNILGVSAWITIAYYFYKIKFFVKI